MIEVILVLVVLWLAFRISDLKNKVEFLDDEIDGLYEDLTGSEIVEGDLFVTGEIVVGGNVTALNGEAATRRAANQ